MCVLKDVGTDRSRSVLTGRSEEVRPPPGARNHAFAARQGWRKALPPLPRGLNQQHFVAPKHRRHRGSGSPHGFFDLGVVGRSVGVIDQLSGVGVGSWAPLYRAAANPSTGGSALGSGDYPHEQAKAPAKIDASAMRLEGQGASSGSGLLPGWRRRRGPTRYAAIPSAGPRMSRRTICWAVDTGGAGLTDARDLPVGGRPGRRLISTSGGQPGRHPLSVARP